MVKISYLATPISLDFRITFIYLLSLSKRLLCKLKVMIIFIILISSYLILVLCAKIGERLIHPCILHAIKYGICKNIKYQVFYKTWMQFEIVSTETKTKRHFIIQDFVFSKCFFTRFALLKSGCVLYTRASYMPSNMVYVKI